MKYVLVGPWLRLIFRPWVQGLEHIPDDGPAILASNHLSFSDSIFLPLMVDRHITFLAKSDYFTGKGIKGRLTAWFFSGVGQVPVDRTGGRASEAAISTGLRVLGEGHLLGIYPEGTRKAPGAPPDYKYGIARLYSDLKVPVVPVVMHPGLFWPRHGFKRQAGHFKVRFLEPIMPGMAPDAFFRHLIEVTETASDQLLIETVRDNPQIDVPESARKRLAELAAGRSEPRQAAAQDA